MCAHKKGSYSPYRKLSLKLLWDREIPEEIVSPAPIPQGLVSTLGFVGLNGKAPNFSAVSNQTKCFTSE